MESLVSENVSQIIGICGVITYLIAYALLQAGIIVGSGYLYATMNAAAACMVIVSLIHAYNLASLLIQVSFIVISIGGIIRVTLLKRVARFSEAERLLYENHFSDLEVHLAHKLFNAGHWVDIKPGTVIAQEGEALDTVTYLSSGMVKITVRGKLVGYRGANTFIGELSFMDNSPATATVEVEEPVHGFVISDQVLRMLLERHTEIRLAATSGLSANTRDTLLRRTEEIVEQGHMAQ